MTRVIRLPFLVRLWISRSTHSLIVKLYRGARPEVAQLHVYPGAVRLGIARLCRCDGNRRPHLSDQLRMWEVGRYHPGPYPPARGLRRLVRAV